ncbi:MAG TPA: AarF/ABC1/UbiB kinase family protein [Nitriliruptorales bacterium]|nr:AarF/ABC1/UbiB kinase family protein [Nitriliruptorales bacterium]
MSRRGLGGRFGRGARLASTGVRSAAGLAAAKARQMSGGDVDPEEFHRTTAELLVDVLGEMKGAAMKLGQLLSFVDVDLPPEVRSIYHEALASLRDSAPPMDPARIEAVVAEEYGAPPGAIFAEWEREPLAAASIGQVHAARLDDGREVVVKVQYPGVAEAVRADLRNAEAFTPLARIISPHLEVEPLIDELRERVGDELNYEREATYQRAFANRYKGHPFIHVPEVVADMCRSRVLVVERVRGRSFNEVADHGTDEDRQRLGEIIFRYAFGTIERFRLFNGDPHPGNYLYEDGGRVAFIDYGSVKMFSRERFEHMQRMNRTVRHGDPQQLVARLRESGFLPPGVAIDADLMCEWWQLYMRPILAEQPFTFTPEFATEVIRSTTDPRSKYLRVLRPLNLPPDYLLLNRIHFGVNSVLGRLRATNDWRAIRDEYSSGGPPATPLGELDRAWWRARSPVYDPPA